MPGKTKIIAYIIALTAITIIVLQTVYRNFYHTFPWSVDAFHTVKYKASLGFIHPDSLTFWILLTGLLLALVVLYFHPVESEHGEMAGPLSVYQMGIVNNQTEDSDRIRRR